MTSSSQTIRFVNPPDLPRPFGYSHVAEVSSGTTIYISGQVALNRSGNLSGLGDLRAQAQQVFENLKVALEAVGADFSAVVKLTYFLLDISQIQMVREVRDQYVNVQQPPGGTHRTAPQGPTHACGGCSAPVGTHKVPLKESSAYVIHAVYLW